MGRKRGITWSVIGVSPGKATTVRGQTNKVAAVCGLADQIPERSGTPAGVPRTATITRCSVLEGLNNGTVCISGYRPAKVVRGVFPLARTIGVDTETRQQGTL